MIVWAFKHLLYLRKAAKSADTPRQLAAGLVLGMLLGLIPKGNLLAVGISMLIFGTEVNIAVAMIAAVAFSFLGTYIDPITHPIGQWLLTRESLQSAWRSLYDIPLAAWTSLNNTVVLGSFTLGLALAFPTYHVGHALFKRRQKRLAAVATNVLIPECSPQISCDRV